MRASRLTAAHKADCLMLLGSPPDMVHSASLHRTHLPAYPYMRKIDLLKRRPVKARRSLRSGQKPVCQNQNIYVSGRAYALPCARSARNVRSARPTAPGLEVICRKSGWPHASRGRHRRRSPAGLLLKGSMFSGVRIRRYARSARNVRSARPTAPGLEVIILHPPQKCNQNRPLFSGNTALFRPAFRRPSALLPEKGPE